jgi:hypothetical protein
MGFTQASTCVVHPVKLYVPLLEAGWLELVLIMFEDTPSIICSKRIRYSIRSHCSHSRNLTFSMMGSPKSIYFDLSGSLSGANFGSHILLLTIWKQPQQQPHT